MSTRSFPLLGLGFGTYLLGIATSLLLVRFNESPDAWQRNTTAVVAGLGILCVASSVVWIARRDFARDKDTSNAASAPRRPFGPAIGADSRTFDSVGTPDLDRPPSLENPQKEDFRTSFGEHVPRRPADDSLSEGRDHERSQREPAVPIDQSQPLGKNAGRNDSFMLAEPAPADLIEVWEAYRREGDGHFTVQGLQDQLDVRNLTATVRENEQVGARDCVLVVETPSRRLDFYVVPSFTKSPRKVSKWFYDHSDGALNGRIEKVLEIAKGRWTESGVGDTIQKGVVA